MCGFLHRLLCLYTIHLAGDLVEEIGRFEALDELDPQGATTVNNLATALNKLGLTTREMTSILQSIKAAGALQAELIIN